MPPSSAKRIAAMAVFRYGVDRARVRREMHEIIADRGEAADLIEVLVVKGLLSSLQGDELRAVLQRPFRGTPLPFGPVERAPEGVDPKPVPRSVGGFRILRRLGEGGMGAVYLGYDEENKQYVAVKVLAEELAANSVCVECFHRESHGSMLLNHPDIVRGITAGRDETTGCHYLVREYVDGPSAYAFLDQRGRLPVGDVVHIGLNIAHALEYLHGRDFVHRDIKPDNLLLARSGAAKLTDLGLLKRIGEPSGQTALQQGFGTSYYMPYEQAVNPRAVDGRSDLYALGATLYHLLTGQVPFPGDNHLEIIQKKDVGVFLPASALNPNVPAELDRILAKMLARRPCDRYPTAGELAADLERSDLASPLPSFADLDAGPEEHGPRTPVNPASQPTSLDAQHLGRRDTPPTGRNAVWYLRYRDPTGRWCKTKATTKQLLRRLRSGRMPATAKACQKPRGPYRPLTTFPLFQESAPPPAPALRETIPRAHGSAVTSSLGWLLLRLTLGLGGLVGLGIALYTLLRAS